MEADLKAPYQQLSIPRRSYVPKLVSMRCLSLLARPEGTTAYLCAYMCARSPSRDSTRMCPAYQAQTLTETEDCAWSGWCASNADAPPVAVGGFSLVSPAQHNPITFLHDSSIFSPSLAPNTHCPPPTAHLNHNTHAQPKEIAVNQCRVYQLPVRQEIE